MAAENRTAEQDAIAIRRTKALELRARHKTFQEIATELGVSIGTAHTDVRAAMREHAQDAESDVVASRGLELARLDRALDVVESVLTNAPTAENGEELQLKALDRLVKIQDQRAKLLGLYAPERKEVDAKIATVALDDLDALRAAATANECSDSPSQPSESEPSS